ncbi:DUF1318 domain-containing protein [Novosphingobium sp. FSY-8]|uniref:DUF1318 domain-containing protein n=1 Tax=Novosphingobium ovatum TaxID=1908523 RepID=A0ABW9XBJ5_9SPHN|nr:YdbL family protein [Novosphingobium ovatum]NBC35900.1 DUF1318 domain-containing protein [Novosphingobium ovatum]
MSKVNGIRMGVMALALGAGVMVAGAAQAQDRDPAYAAARAAGQVGEKPDGYLGVVGAAPAEIQRMVVDLNIRRKAIYATRAQAQNSTIDKYAEITGCKLIAQTVPGEKYMDPSGAWQTRGGDAPVRRPDCP